MTKLTEMIDILNTCNCLPSEWTTPDDAVHQWRHYLTACVEVCDEHLEDWW